MTIVASKKWEINNSNRGENMKENAFLEELAKAWLASWPAPFVPQKAIAEFTGELMQKQTLVNLCNQGRGPEGKFYLRGQACWKKEVMVAWLLDTLAISYNGPDIKSKAPHAKHRV